jgi:hypothetical protein
MPVPDFSPGEVLTAAAMDSIGMWLVSTTAVGAGAASVPVNNCFSSDYQSYRVIMEFESSNGTASHTIQLQGITTAVYFVNGYLMTYTSNVITGFGPVAQVNFVASANNAASQGTTIIFDITNPNLAKRKYCTISAQGSIGVYFVQGLCTSTAVSTGMTIAKGGDTMTGGSIRVYGMRN